MAVYGQYETVAELGRDGSTSVSRARPADGGWELGFDDLGSDATFALKAFRVRNAEDAGGVEAERFHECVRAQKRAAEQSKHWAPVLEAGTARNEAYYVTQYYPSTAARLAEGRTPVDGRALYEVVTGVLAGLADLKRGQRRPHGNLKSANVLLRSAAHVTADDVVLSDPAVEADAEIAGEVEDLYNLGEVIYHLVRGERFAGQHTWPVKATEHWRALGRHGEAWLRLCNHLLSPRAAENWLRVDDIQDEVAALRPPKQRLRSKKLWAAVAAVAVVGGAGTWEYYRYTGLWRELCGAYERWVGPAEARLAAAPPRAIKEDPYLNERLVLALAEARSRNVELNPQRIAGNDSPLALLAERPPLSIGAVWKTEKAARVVREVDRSLAPERWTALAEMERRRADFAGRGWEKLRVYAAGAIAGARRENNPDWVGGIDELVRVDRQLARLDAARASLRTRLARLEAKAESAPTVREQVDQFASAARRNGESDVIVATPAGVESLASLIEEADRSGAAFEGLMPLLADAAKRQRAYEVRGWAGPATYLGGLIDRARSGGDFAGLNEELTAAKRTWEQVEAQWAQTEQRRRTLESSGDPLLSSYRQYVAHALSTEPRDLSALLRRLEEVNDDPAWGAAARKVSEPEWAKFDVAGFAQRSEAHRGMSGKPFAATADLRKWMLEVEGYDARQASVAMRPDPRGGGADSATVVPPGPTTVAVTPTPTTTPVPTPAPSPAPEPVTRPTQVAVAPPATTRNTSPSPAPATRTVAIATTRPVEVAVQPPAATTMPAPAPAPDPEQVKRAREVAAFVTECREVGINARERGVKDAWRQANVRMAELVEKNPAAYTPDLRARRDALRGRLLQLDSAYRSASAPLALKAGSQPWGAALAEKLGTVGAPQWGATLQGLIDLAVAGDARFEDALGGLVDTDEQWRASAARLVADADRLARRLADGYTPLDTSTAGALSAVRSSELLKHAEVRQVLEPVLGPVTWIESSSDDANLRKIAAADEAPLGVRLMAWSKTATGPTGEAFARDLDLAGKLLEAARGRLADKSRVEEVKSRLEGDVRGRWEVLLEGARRPEDVAYAVAARERVTGINLGKLSPRAQFNVALADLRAAVAGATGENADRQIAPAAQRVRLAAAGLPEVERRDRTVATLMAEIDRTGQPAQVDFTKLGPMSEAAARAAGGKVSWTAAVDDGGERVTYRASLPTDTGREDVALAFRRVRLSEGGRASWVATTETSLGLFTNLVTTAAKWTEVRQAKWLPEYQAGRVDPRKGPRVWEWPRYGRSPVIVRSLVWLSGDFVPPGLDHYPDTIGSEFNRSVVRDARGERSEELNPSRRQPMQWVSPPAALLAASVAGCRLPTADEWRAARKSEEQSVGVNLRDRTWLLELRHMARPQFGGRCRPDAGMFVPAGEKPSDAVYKTPSGGEVDDGILWFREVPSTAAVFVDLTGNVAEFVTDDAGKVHVIGGSSVSPPERALDEPFALGADQATGGFSDVGFRLAFSEPAAGVERLREVVANAVYLTAK